MTSKPSITRRDFLGGMALGVAGLGTLTPLELLAAQGSEMASRYPPALTGMRGSHPGSFEVAHSVAREGQRFPRPPQQTDETYDLVVVGGGISGLSAARLFRDQAGQQARILVLDNHDDFGGHAKRNEFSIEGRQLICYGGSQTLDSPGSFSPASRRLIRELGIEPDRFYQYFDRQYFERRNLRSGIYFREESYGRDSINPSFYGAGDRFEAEKIIAGYPLSEQSRLDLIRLLRGDRDYLEDVSTDRRVETLRGMSYDDFLRKRAYVTEEVVILIRDCRKGLWGYGLDSLSALEGWRLEMPGTRNLDLGGYRNDYADGEPYIFHFPDGNASVARLLVRDLIPGALPGESMEDAVLARADYSALDQDSNQTRIRLDSTAVDVRHSDDQQFVDVTYVRGGAAERVRGRHVILACYHSIIPHICPDLPAEQARLMGNAEKTPLVYLSIGVRNWKAFENLGYHGFYLPQAPMMHHFQMDFPVSMGGYSYTRSADEPTVIHGTWCPVGPAEGLGLRERMVLGRQELFETSFAQVEEDIVRQMNGALARGGFDAERDIFAITVNRWPHGYADEYNELFDPPGWGPDRGPHVEASAPMVRISIANSDAAALAYVNGAIDAAVRAVSEQLAVG